MEGERDERNMRKEIVVKGMKKKVKAKITDTDNEKKSNNGKQKDRTIMETW